MKLKRTETHDRLLEFNKQADLIAKGCQDCIKNRPPEFENHPFYIFAHKREIGLDERIGIYNDDLYYSLSLPGYIRQYTSVGDTPTHRMIWCPRLTKPTPQENSMLFKSYPLTDNIKIIWMIPQKELWDQYIKGNMLESNIVCDSIHAFKNDMKKLQEAEPDDLSDDMIRAIFKKMHLNDKSKIIKPNF